MSGITEVFERAAAANRAVVIPYLMTGYPDPGMEVELAEALERGGADILEIGMPFSDPIADGPTIQRVATHSLEKGTTIRKCLETAAAIHARCSMPLVLMGYYNPVRHYGLERFCSEAAAAGVEGLILPDLPPEEAEDTREVAIRHGIDIIFLLAPTSTETRISQAAKVAGGFIYCVSLTGVTGARAELSVGLDDFIARVRRHTELPLAVGFGISRPEHVQHVGQIADGVVVASALIELIDRLEPTARTEGVEVYIRSLRDAADRGVPAGMQGQVEA